MAESALVRTVKAKKKPVSMFSARVEFCAELGDLNLVLESELGRIMCIFIYNVMCIIYISLAKSSSSIRNQLYN
jgi:hypothetical protein